MSTKTLVMIGMTVGSIVGGYLPVLLGVSAFSYLALFTGALGALLGIWVGYKLGQ